jgi:serine/threonine-protein kinase
MTEDLLKLQNDFFKKQPTSTLFITNVQKIYGTPAYLSPEQIRFEALSPQTDIYSLGITLYELLTGSPPFDGTLIEIMAKHITHKVPTVHKQNPRIPEAVDRVISTATAKNPGERYPDVLAFAKAFREACGS